MANVIHAAEDGKTGDAGQFRDYRYKLAGGKTSGNFTCGAA